MALLITKDVSILGEISINEIYTRLNLVYDYTGSYMSVETKNYVSRNSFDLEAGMTNYGLEIDGIPGIENFEYINSDGDILLASHNKLKDYLSTDITDIVVVIDPSTGVPVYIQDPVLDPSTGEQMTDPSTGDLLWQDGDPSTAIEITRHKFCPAEDIAIVDISMG